MNNFNDQNEPDIDAIAAGAEVHVPTNHLAIEPDSDGTPIPGSTRPSSGSYTRDHKHTWNPADFADRPGPAPAVLPSSGRSAARHYMHSQAVSSANAEAREAARPGSLPASQTVAPTKAMTTAWQAVQFAHAEAREAVALVPTKIAEAEQKRAEQVGQTEDPVVLPSVADTRDHWDTKAVAACRRVVDLRAEYDATVEAEADAHHKALGKSIPKLSTDVLDRVRDLGVAVRDLREGVSAFVEVAGSSSPDVMPARLPRAADLSALGAIEKEVEQLVAVTEAPSQPRISPTLDERRRIAAEAARVPTGLSPEMVDLARRERAESFRWTELTKGIPADVLESFARSQSAFL